VFRRFALALAFLAGCDGATTIVRVHYRASGKTLTLRGAEELKPKVDAEFRTMPARETTALMGSSLGGLISSYAGVTHADTFGMIGAMSPSTWWADQAILGLVRASPASPRPLRVYLDSGDSGVDDDDVTQTAKLAEVYRALGYVEGRDLKYVVQKGAVHNETYWAQRLPEALHFLLGPR